MKAFCRLCKTETNHDILSQNKQIHIDERVDYHVTNIWEIIKCRGCDNLSAREVWYGEDDWDPSTGEMIKKVTVHPRSNENFHAIKYYHNFPLSLFTVYKETIDAYNNELYILCAGGLRALIEGICKNLRINDGPIVVSTKNGPKTVRRKHLDGKLSGLHEKKYLTKSHSAILNQHRFLGNEALHDLKEPNALELKVAIEIIEHTIDSIFELQDKAKSLQRMKSKRKS